MYGIDQNTVGVTVRYQEPTTRADGSLITNLDHCNVIYQLDVGAGIEQPNLAATTTNGGGIVTTIINVALPIGQASTVNWWVIATDATGLTSASSNEMSVYIDRRFYATPTAMPHLSFRPGFVM